MYTEVSLGFRSLGLTWPERKETLMETAPEIRYKCEISYDFRVNQEGRSTYVYGTLRRDGGMVVSGFMDGEMVYSEVIRLEDRSRNQGTYQPTYGSGSGQDRQKSPNLIPVLAQPPRKLRLQARKSANFKAKSQVSSSGGERGYLHNLRG